ncbi:MAG TPA: Flp family type IVb pilin [Chloroflexota bacterium]|nr:Flp family type IVb pilin [Chloroflexota bacterium]
MMVGLRSLAGRFAGDERGATSIEYGLIALLVAVGFLAGLMALGQGNTSSWGDTAAKVSNAMKGN